MDGDWFCLGFFIYKPGFLLLIRKSVRENKNLCVKKNHFCVRENLQLIRENLRKSLREKAKLCVKFLKKVYVKSGFHT